MQLTKETEYALRGLAFLAAQPRQHLVSLADVAEAQQLPGSFLAKIFQKLVRHGVLGAERGPGSGYRLLGDPAALSVRKIIEAVEGPAVFERCVFWQGHCSDANACPLHFYVSHVRQEIQGSLQSVTLAEYMRDAHANT